MARTAAGGRPVRVVKRVGKTRTTFYANTEFNRRGGRARFNGSGSTEALALLDLAVKLHLDGHSDSARKVAEWVRSAYPTEPIPEILGFADAPVAPASIQKHLVSALLDAFLKRRVTEVSKGTFDRDRGKIKNHIRPGLGHLYLEDLDKDALKQFFYDLSQKPKVRAYYDPETRTHIDPQGGEKLLGPSPLRDIYTILNLVFQDAIERRYIDKNPLIGIPRAKRDGKSNDDFEMAAAFEVFDDLLPQLAPSEQRQFLLGFFGLRQSERLGLGRGSIVVDGGQTFLVVKQQLKREGLEVSQILKTKASYRKFAVPNAMLPYLSNLQEWRNGIGPMGPMDTLICTDDGKPIRHQTDTRHWHRVLASRGYPIYNQHKLRHWAATFLARTDGVTETMARNILGHSDVLMTRYYTARDAVAAGAGLTSLAAAAPCASG